MLNSQNVGLLILDSRGWIQSLTGAISEIIEVERGEILSKNIKSLFDLSLDQIKDQSNRIEFIFETSNGKKKHLSVHHVESDGVLWDPDFHILVINNHTQEKLKSLEDEYNRSLFNINRMMPVVFNEFKGALSSISSLAEAILEDYQDLKYFDELNLLYKKVQRVLLRVDSLTLGGREVFTYHTIDVNTEIQIVFDLISHYADQFGVKTNLDMQEIPPLQINEAVIRAIMANVLRNAIDASKRNDIVETKAFFSDDNELVIEVKDYGVGMKPYILERCTEPFFTTKTFGTGTGLTLCKTIVESAGGSMIISSQPGKGTQVRISIPV